MKVNHGVRRVLISCLLVFSQLTVRAADSTSVFTVDNFMGQIVAHHPVARQAHLLSEQARQEIRMARGAFDPTANVRFYKKGNYSGCFF